MYLPTNVEGRSSDRSLYHYTVLRRVNQDVRCYVPQEHSRQRHRPQFKYCQCCVDSLRIAPTLHAWELFLFFTVPSPMHSCAFIVAWIARAFFVEREVVQGGCWSECQCVFANMLAIFLSLASGNSPLLKETESLDTPL